jgi:HpcH/HpaI aldolase/citrate lyase family
MLQWMLITANPEAARYAESCGVGRIFVDMEVIGKHERQGHLDTHKACHTLTDVARVRDAICQAELMVRLNPLHEGTADEIEGAVRSGADRLMLPMFRTATEVRVFRAMVDVSVPITLLAETPQALVRLAAYLPELKSGDELYFGLNDLSLGLGLEFLFEPLAGGLLDRPAEVLQERRIPFGFGGVARLQGGDLPAEYILGEHVRLGSSWVILSRAFVAGASLNDPGSRQIDLEYELARLRDCEQKWRAAGISALELNRQQLVERVLSIVSQKEPRHGRVGVNSSNTFPPAGQLSGKPATAGAVPTQ